MLHQTNRYEEKRISPDLWPGLHQTCLLSKLGGYFQTYTLPTRPSKSNSGLRKASPRKSLTYNNFIPRTSTMSGMVWYQIVERYTFCSLPLSIRLALTRTLPKLGVVSRSEVQSVVSTCVFTPTVYTNWQHCFPRSRGRRQEVAGTPTITKHCAVAGRCQPLA